MADNENKIAVIGDYDSIYGFAALGLNIFPVNEPDVARKKLITLANSGYGIIYITKDGEIHCANHVGEQHVPGVMYSRYDDDGNWLVYVASRNGNVLQRD